MASNQCPKGQGCTQYYPKNGKLSWGIRKKGQAWVLSKLSFFCLLSFFSISLFAKSEDDEDFSEISKVYKNTDSIKDYKKFDKDSFVVGFNYRINSRELRNLGARYLIDALKLFPQVFFVIFGLDETTIGIHGTFGNNRVQIIIDGQRVNNPYDGTWFYYIPIEIIEYIDIYYGPQGTLFGEGSLIASIFVQRKKSPDKSFFSFYDTFNTFSLGFLANHRIRLNNFGISGSFITDKLPLKKINKTQTGFYDGIDALYADAFFDINISEAAKAYFLGKTNVSLVKKNLESLLNNRFSLHNDIHLIRRTANKKHLDLFLSNSFFQYYSLSKNHTDEISNFKEKNSSLRLELGIKSQLNLLPEHEIYFGVGGLIQGILNDPTFVQYEKASNLAKPIEYKKNCQIFGRKSALFSSCNGHVYAFLQDEWQIRPSFLAQLGGRAVFPIEKSGDVSAEFLPSIGMVLTPHRNWRMGLSFQSSLRTPLVKENFTSFFRYLSKDDLNSNLDYERSRSLAASVKFGNTIESTDFSVLLNGHLSKIDEAILRDLNGKLSNNNEIDIMGVDIGSDFSFLGGHNLSFGVSYSLAYNKGFGDDGYANCSSGFYSPFMNKKYCPLERAVPSLIAHILFDADILSGIFGVSTHFYKFNSKRSRPMASLDLNFHSKVFFGFMTFFASLKNIVGDILINKLDSPKPLGLDYRSTLLFGFSLNP